MPKFGTHIVIGEGVARSLGREDWTDPGDAGNALRLGSIGPDLALFLFDPVQGDAASSFVFKSLQQGLSVYGHIRKFRDKLDELENYLGSPPKDIADWFTGGFSTSMLETVGLSIDAFISALKVVVFFESKLTIINPLADMPDEIKDLLSPQGNAPVINVPVIEFTPRLDPDDITSPAYIFRYFGAPYTNDPPFKVGAAVGSYSDWWWMDILHYRRTTRFARRLLELARESGSDVQLAYATGYISHVAGDIVGHPYINSLVGGPFRNHALRHMVIESLVDVVVWGNRKGEDIINSRLDKLVSLSNGARDEICDLFHKALNDVYVAPSDGSSSISSKNFGSASPSSGDLAFSYEVMIGYLGSATDVDLHPPVKPPESLGEVWDEIRESLARSASEIDKYVRDLRTKSGWDWLAALIGLVMWSAVQIVKILTLPAAVIARVAAVAPRWVLFLINSALYVFIRNVRYCMALCGWGYASISDLDRSMSENLLTVRSPFDDDHYAYPYAMTQRKSGFWLEYPTRLNTPIEEPRTFPGPYRRHSTPFDFIDGFRFDWAHEAELKSLTAEPPVGSAQLTNEKLRDIYFDLPEKSSLFGNAVDFAVMLHNGQFPEGYFDLDGDRGYGSLQWEDYPPNSEYIK